MEDGKFYVQILCEKCCPPEDLGENQMKNICYYVAKAKKMMQARMIPCVAGGCDYEVIMIIMIT